MPDIFWEPLVSIQHVDCLSLETLPDNAQVSPFSHRSWVCSSALQCMNDLRPARLDGLTRLNSILDVAQNGLITEHKRWFERHNVPCLDPRRATK